MTFYHFVMKILRRFHLKYALGTSNYLLLGRGGEWRVLLGRWLSYSFYRFYSTSPVNHVITPKSSTHLTLAIIKTDPFHEQSIFSLDEEHFIALFFSDYLEIVSQRQFRI